MAVIYFLAYVSLTAICKNAYTIWFYVLTIHKRGQELGCFFHSLSP